eukprot:TRINITY_DN6721_c0_g1_i1.p2 TRINITY_DN6721_c0_g1~~TRINITY_DN6721_c0_g1_i1.p2  ORF type:complete len:167 (+),score=28.47 TRINITY_DN6721_c0_g1_i1:255-755(+)
MPPSSAMRFLLSSFTPRFLRACAAPWLSAPPECLRARQCASGCQHSPRGASERRRQPPALQRHFHREAPQSVAAKLLHSSDTRVLLHGSQHRLNASELGNALAVVIPREVHQSPAPCLLHSSDARVLLHGCQHRLNASELGNALLVVLDNALFAVIIIAGKEGGNS